VGVEEAGVRLGGEGGVAAEEPDAAVGAEPEGLVAGSFSKGILDEVRCGVTICIRKGVSCGAGTAAGYPVCPGAGIEGGVVVPLINDAYAVDGETNAVV
jgi:hypothetical protein